MKLLYQTLIYLGNGIQPILLLLIRLVCGFGFFQAGFGKWDHLAQVSDFFAHLHIPFPTTNAYFIAGLETVGGLFLMMGFGSRLVALLLTINMIVAYSTAHMESVRALLVDPGLFIAASPFLFLYSSLIILAFGPGILSVDAVLKRFMFKK